MCAKKCCWWESKVIGMFPIPEHVPLNPQGLENIFKSLRLLLIALFLFPFPLFGKTNTIKSHCWCGRSGPTAVFLNLALLKVDILDVRVISPVLCYIKIINKLARAINVPT